jgi:thiol-disulfide isomerase/thioredoxin
MKQQALFFMACMLLGCSGPAATDTLKCPDIFRKVTFSDLEGRPASIPCQEHQVLVVNFWATWCMPCKLEVPHLSEIAQAYKAKGVYVVGIALDSGAPAALKQAVASFGISYPVLMGNAEQVLQRAGIDGIPATFIISADGTVYRKLVGYHTKEELLAPITELLKRNKENAPL